MHNPSHRITGLFAGVGGVEAGLSRALGNDMQTNMLCEWWEPAQSVLQARFKGVNIHPDVRGLKDIPADTTLVTAGFPCTDLSQAGRTAGIDGINSGLVKHAFEVLERRAQRNHRPSLLIENVPNMLTLNKGTAMIYLIRAIEALGYRWAYRVVDSRFTGVPQRRRRVIILASSEYDPRDILLSDDAGARSEESYRDNAFGFYWTEGRRGLGWAQDAIPTLKSGSTVGIPSPPAIWFPNAESGHEFVKPTIENAEILQGFHSGWTDVDFRQGRPLGHRWKMMGNAVTVGVSEWAGKRLQNPGEFGHDYTRWEPTGRAWPTNAFGGNGKIYTVQGLSEFPEHQPYRHLRDVVDPSHAEPLSERAATGFARRLFEGNLGQHPGFRPSLSSYVDSFARTSSVA